VTTLRDPIPSGSLDMVILETLSAAGRKQLAQE